MHPYVTEPVEFLRTTKVKGNGTSPCRKWNIGTLIPTKIERFYTYFSRCHASQMRPALIGPSNMTHLRQRLIGLPYDLSSF